MKCSEHEAIQIGIGHMLKKGRGSLSWHRYKHSLVTTVERRCVSRIRETVDIALCNQ